MLSVSEYVAIAMQYTATVYGFSEKYCGDYGQPEPCVKGATTASGEEFDPEIATVAVPMPKRRILRPATVRLQAHDGSCVELRVTDKKAERYIGASGLDLTPAAVRLITGAEATPHWSGKLTECEE